MKREDQKYLDWLSYQRSCLDGTFGQYLDGVGRNIACHVRRASHAGTGYKPLYSAVPMTQRQHDLQSQQGELAALMAYTNYPFILGKYPGTGVDQAKAHFDYLADHYEKLWRKTQ